MASSIPRATDTVIIGNGPGALILSYILHGNIPYYDGGHPDKLLHTKLSKQPSILDVTPNFYEHFHSSLRYSTQALPINTFLDTLLRPNADTEVNPQSCIRWNHEPERAVPHVVLGSTSEPGGQWQSNPVDASWDIGTLSYAEMLSLPGYTFAQYWREVHGEPMPDFVRPSRKEVAAYLRAYPSAVRIVDSIYNGQEVSKVSRSKSGFFIGSHQIRCKHLVLASGTFSKNLAPPPPLAALTGLHASTAPLLVVGSGFSAADAIISAGDQRRIIHLYKWAPEARPSPLKGCHHQAYPEYAGIYKQMKLAYARRQSSSGARPMLRRKSKSYFGSRDWSSTYEGFHNATIETVDMQNGQAVVQIRCADGDVVERTVGEMQYVVGRRGTLGYLEDALLREVTDGATVMDASKPSVVSTRTLRPKAEKSLEMTPGVFIIGSLAGDSLIRHTFGSCVYAAARILKDRSRLAKTGLRGSSTTLKTRLPAKRFARHFDKGESLAHCNSSNSSGRSSRAGSSESDTPIDHQDLHIDRRTLPKADTSPKTPVRVKIAQPS